MADQIISCEKTSVDAGVVYAFVFSLDVSPTPVEHTVCVYAKEMGDPSGKTDLELADEAKTLALPRASAAKARITAPCGCVDVPSVVGEVTL